jgi:hypothetical protein
MKKSTAGDKTFILELKNGNTRKITIPATWKLTFGQLVPHTLRDTHGASSAVALRIYEGSKENLRAVMTDVVAVRDASISVMEKRTTVQRKAAQRQTSQGAKDVVVEARVTEWIDPDADPAEGAPNEFLKLTDGSEF